MEKFQLKGDFIKLDQLLKVTNIASSGGEAKIYIYSQLVTVNGVIAEQRGKKIRKGDIVQYKDKKIEVI